MGIPPIKTPVRISNAKSKKMNSYQLTAADKLFDTIICLRWQSKLRPSSKEVKPLKRQPVSEQFLMERATQRFVNTNCPIHRYKWCNKLFQRSKSKILITKSWLLWKFKRKGSLVVRFKIPLPSFTSRLVKEMVRWGKLFNCHWIYQKSKQDILFGNLKGDNLFWK